MCAVRRRRPAASWMTLFPLLHGPHLEAETVRELLPAPDAGTLRLVRLGTHSELGL